MTAKSRSEIYREQDKEQDKRKEMEIKRDEEQFGKNDNKGSNRKKN